MNVKVRYFNILAALTGRREEAIGLPDGAACRQLLGLLASRHGPELAKLIFQDVEAGRFSPYLRVFINGKSVEHDRLDDQLHEGDEVMMFPAVAGG
jgi:MoaD family protein